MSSAPRWAKVSARRPAPAVARAKAIASPRSIPAELVWARTSSVAGFESAEGVPVPVCHRPAR